MRNEPNEAWRNKIKWYFENNHFLRSESHRRKADGVRVENTPRIHNLGPARGDSKKNLKDLQCEPEQFDNRIIFMSMYHDIVWREEGNATNCENNSLAGANYARRLPRGRWSFLGPGSEKKWSFSSSQSCPLVHDPHLPCDDPRQSGGSTEVPSPTQGSSFIERVQNVERDGGDIEP